MPVINKSHVKNTSAAAIQIGMQEWNTAGRILGFKVSITLGSAVLRGMKLEWCLTLTKPSYYKNLVVGTYVLE